VSRLLIGYALAVIVGIAFGVLIGSAVRCARFEPTLEFLRAIRRRCSCRSSS
jgi:ABC-type nitrate/sulfonate/bicarbonate transport system permease component